MAMKEGPRDPDYDRDAPEWYLHFRDQIQALAENEAEAEPVRAAAISALGELSTDPRFQDTWLPFLENPSPVLRAAALSRELPPATRPAPRTRSWRASMTQTPGPEVVHLRLATRISSGCRAHPAAVDL